MSKLKLVDRWNLGVSIIIVSAAVGLGVYRAVKLQDEIKVKLSEEINSTEPLNFNPDQYPN